MSEVFQLIVTLAQFAYLLWPLFILVTLAYAAWGFGLRGMLRRLYDSLFYTWTLLFGIWVVTLFASGPNLSLLPEPYNSLIFFSGYALLLVSKLLKSNHWRRFLNRLKEDLAGRVLARTQARLDIHQVRALDEIKSMDPYQFEHLVTELYRAEGYRARQTGQSGDHGVDVEVFTPDGARWIVQCKRYRDSIGEEVIRELYGTLHHEGAQRAVLVTSAETTVAAESWARGKPIELIDGPALVQWIDRVAARNRPSLFDRLAAAVQSFFRPQVTFSANRNASEGSPELSTRTSAPQIRSLAVPSGASSTNLTVQPPARQPAVLNPIERQVVTITSRPAPPTCPRCGVPMVPRPSRPGDRPGRILFRCRNYPDCRVVLDA